MNGNLKWLFSLIGGMIVIIVTGWLITTSAEMKANSTDVAVLKSQFTQLKCDVLEIKDVVKDIRSDQIRRALREK